MNKIFTLAVALLLASCTQSLKVEVLNSTDVNRQMETVTIPWQEVAQLDGITKDNVVVKLLNEEVPSQVIFEGEEPTALIFQASVKGQAQEEFTIVKGERKVYPTMVYGRQVPERYDDYTWENNRIAFRMYGPSLETSPEKLITPGIDIWLKSVQDTVINRRYALADYHHDHGDGMDCYKVGKTLGGGSSVAFADGKLCPMTHNYATCETLANGPIRHTVRLVYPAYEVNGKEVVLTKIITLDANTHFNKMQSIYEGEFDKMEVVAGFVRHDIKEEREGEGWFAMVEAASDTKHPVEDGDIYGAILMPESKIMLNTEGHNLALTTVKPNEVMTYYSAAGWSKGGEVNGIESMDEWEALLKEKQAMVLTPLQVSVALQ